MARSSRPRLSRADVTPGLREDRPSRARRQAALLSLLFLSLLGSGACGRGESRGDERYATQQRAASEHASLEELRAGLGRLAAWHREHGTAVAERLAPGLDRQAIHDRVAQAGVRLPEELIALYEWHDGTVGGCDDFAGPVLVVYHCFLSLDEALARRDRDGRLYGMPERWFPLFAFQEEYFYVVLDDGDAEALPIFHRLLEDEGFVAFTNLRTLVDTFVEAARRLAWHPDHDAQTSWGTVEQIRARRNPLTDPSWPS